MPRQGSSSTQAANAALKGSGKVAGDRQITQSENNLLLLRYLADHGAVASRKAWAQGALAWIEAAGGRNYLSNLLTATYSVDSRFVERTQAGSSHRFAISHEGRLALEQRLPVRIRGRGWFHGIGAAAEVLTADS